jgi:GNAT superfamily N-acetyltransferase
VHDWTVRGLPVERRALESVIWEKRSSRISVVGCQPSDEEHEWFRYVCLRGSRETGTDWFDFDGRLEERWFLFIESDRLLGALVTDLHHNSWKNVVVVDEPSIPSLRAAWVHPSHRRRGIATRLLREAARYQGVAVESLGLVIPFSTAGLGLAERFFPHRLKQVDVGQLRKRLESREGDRAARG